MWHKTLWGYTSLCTWANLKHSTQGTREFLIKTWVMSINDVLFWLMTKVPFLYVVPVYESRHYYYWNFLAIDWYIPHGWLLFSFLFVVPVKQNMTVQIVKLIDRICSGCLFLWLYFSEMRSHMFTYYCIRINLQWP